MSFITKITFYPKIAFRYLSSLLLRLIVNILNFFTNIGLIIIGFLLGLSLLTYNKFDQSINTSSDEVSTNLISLPGSYISDLLIQTAGIASLLVPLAFILLGFFAITKRAPKAWKSIFLFLISIFCLSLSVELIAKNGGIIGYFLNSQLIKIAEIINIEISEYLIAIFTLIFFIFSIFSGSLALQPLHTKSKGKNSKKEEIINEPIKEAPKARILRPKKKNTAKVPVENVKPKKSNMVGNYEMPSLDLLKEVDENEQNYVPDNLIEENRNILSNALKQFGVEGEIENVRTGPVVSIYELKPAPGIKTKRVISLAPEIAREMSVASVRIAVVPGKNFIGIELPNDNRNTVYLREIFESSNFQEEKRGIPLSLGKDIGGSPIIADLSLMPHLLISGTTGSGKSVGINGMILSILYKFKPEDCRLIMVDPKMLELSVYDGIPHLLTPVVTNPKKAVVALKWVVREMEERYKKMAILSVRNMAEYNKKAEEYSAQDKTFKRRVHTGYDEQQEPIYEEEEITAEKMPFIVVVIDEMADLMLVARNEIEHLVQRLAQMARAAGIHVIMATQRPSVDVVTGTIKANFPTRISFRVASMIDSRTILNEMGAEQLLGNGDMLFLSDGGRVTRVHGPFVSDSEVEKIVTHIRKQENPDYIDDIVEENLENASETNIESDSEDTLFNQAVAIVTKDKRVSISYVQRKLQIGYNRAARIIEEMEERGIVSAPNNQGKRELLNDID
ncbi:MAG: DNA translocase FtsK 4TM domain-containing protein [Pseudomonadota bacterium]|nr:DNA translocase FtsK 4TM domain-containing protein [Pseudomonadota bacterium]MEC9458602.1 DNA translocase FtsK 4TM domain-containing protein [Pseudomonadota bacterium]